MERKEFFEKVSAKSGADVKEVEQVFQKFIDLTTTALRDGERVNLAGFGSFIPKITKATKKFSAILNREIEIPEKFKVSFSPSTKVAEEINIKYKDEKPQVIKEALEREIEKKVTITPEEKEEEVTKAEKLLEEISKLEELENVEREKDESEEVSLSAEILEALGDAKIETEQAQLEAKPEKIETLELKETKEEVSAMPEMNLNQDKPKFTYGEDLSTPSAAGGYQQSIPSASNVDAPSFRQKESSNALWITLIVLLVGIIGIGIYWALTSDITETKKEPVMEIQKETTPPVVIEKQPKAGKKEIIVAPEEYASIPPDTAVKQRVPLIVEEPRKEITTAQKQKTKTEITKAEEIKQQTYPVERRKPITRRAAVRKVTTPVSAGDYYIQVNSYTDKKFADSFARNLRNKGYRAFVESAENPVYGKVYRVKVGFYIDEDAASKDFHSLRLLLKKEDIYVDRR